MKVAPIPRTSKCALNNGAESISLELLRMAASSPPSGRAACDQQEMVRLIQEFASALGIHDLASALGSEPKSAGTSASEVQAPEPPRTPSDRWSMLKAVRGFVAPPSNHNRSSHPPVPQLNSAFYQLTLQGTSPEVTAAILALVVFFAFGVLYFSLAEGFTIIDSLYFTVVVLTTVGYGDLGPFSARAKVVICFFVLYAMLLAAQALGILTNAALKKAEEVAAAAAAENKKMAAQEKQMARQGAQPVISHEEVKRRRAQARHRERNIKRLKAVLSMCGIVLVGTVYYAADPLEHKGWGDAFYMCVITVTTVGFGDFSPSSARGRIFAGAARLWEGAVPPQ